MKVTIVAIFTTNKCCVCVWWLLFLNYFFNISSLLVCLSDCRIAAELQVLYELFCVRCSLRQPHPLTPPHPMHLHHVSILQLRGWESTCLRLEICVNDSHLGQLMRPRVTSQEPLRCLAYLHSLSLSVFSDAVVGFGAAHTQAVLSD